MTGVTFEFDDVASVWREVPSVPRAGEALVYEGRQYIVRSVCWYGTDGTWAAWIKCKRL